VVLLGLIVGVRSLAYAVGDDEYSRLSLRGLPGVGVLIGDIAPNAARDGLRRRQLQTAVESRLRKAGIRVLTLEELRRHPRHPTLHIEVVTAKAPKQKIYAINVSAELQQVVVLDHNPPIVTRASTWSSSIIGIVETRGMSQVVRKTVEDIVDEFIRDYLQMNAPQPQVESKEQET
jgi:hypothetical protein